MPVRKSYRKKASPYKKRRMGRRRVARRSGNVPEWASLSETTDFGSLVVGTTYNLNDLQLGQFDRASAVAQGYQFFRIKKLTFKVQPLLDTFSSAGATQVPYLLWSINKAGYAYPGLLDDWFYANGSKPIRFDDKTITIGYSPCAILDVAEASVPGVGNQANLAKQSPWLNTNRNAFVAAWAPSVVSHTGHVMKVSSPGSSQAMNYRLTCTAEFQFKKPLSLIKPDPVNVQAIGVSDLITLRGE